LTIAENAARENGLTSIRKITLEIGQFSGVDAGALGFAFGVLKRGTVLERAEFEYLTPQLWLYCSHCETEYLGDAEDPRCPTCEGSAFRILRGRELLVKSIVGE
jgi:hydrogenase nickel incorporation protein HypA/HybF